MSYIVDWHDLPRTFRDKMWLYFEVRKSYPELLNLALIKHNCGYNNNTAIFESEAHYTWFVLRWS